MRICKTCREPLLTQAYLSHSVEVGVYCCDEYFHEGKCLDASFKGLEQGWDEHYSEDGDCYYTEWEIDKDYLKEKLI